DLSSSPSSGGTGGVDDRFTDAAESAGLFQPSVHYLTFGAMFCDVDLDGRKDIITANGHINEAIGRFGTGITYAERMQLFHNEGGGRFVEMGRRAGPPFQDAIVGRGLAVGDFDGDGNPDLLVTANNDRAALLRNEGGNRNHWLAIRPRGVKSNRDGLGTRVVLLAAGRKEIGWVRSGSSYCSDSEHVARFGLGQAPQADMVEL